MASVDDNVERVTLLDWVKNHHSEDEMRDVFLNMDIALKYIHDHGYCIDVFYPTKIDILDDQPDHIQFESIIKIPSEANGKRDVFTRDNARKEIVKEDIFNSALIQIGLYTNTIGYLTPEFLRSNFDDLARFVPEGDVPYYRGVVQRGSSVYLNEYTVGRVNRDLEQLEKQIQESEGGKVPITKEKTLNEPESISNDRINDSIYKQLSGLRDVAFISYLLIPTIVLVTLFIIAFVSWLFSLF